MRVAPCVGCGYCCQKVLCFLGVSKYGSRAGPCPALVCKDGRYWCGIIMEAAEPEKSRYKDWLAIGGGCSSSLFNTQRDAMIRARLVAAEDQDD